MSRSPIDVHRQDAIEAGAAAMYTEVYPSDHGMGAFTRAYTSSFAGVDTALYAKMDWYNLFGDLNELVDELAAMDDSAQLAAAISLIRPGMMAEIVRVCHIRGLRPLLKRLMDVDVADRRGEGSIQLEVMARRQAMAAAQVVVVARRVRKEEEQQLQQSVQAELAELCAALLPLPETIERLKRLLAQIEKKR